MTVWSSAAQTAEMWAVLRVVTSDKRSAGLSVGMWVVAMAVLTVVLTAGK